MGSLSGINSLLSNISSSSSSSSAIDLSSLLQAAMGATSSGIDVTSAVNAAIYAGRAPERQWQTEQASISAQVTALTGIQGSLTRLSTDLQDLNSVTGSLASRTVSSSQSVVTGAAASAAPVGAHSISVQSLATSTSWYSPALSSSVATGTSTLTITSGSGTQYTIPADSLNNLAQSINSSGAGVTASVINDASGSRLSLVSLMTGSAADFSVSYGVTGASSWASATEPNASTALSAGSFQVGDGTSTAAITVSAGDTLTNVASNINAAGLGLTASVITSASGAYLQLNASSGASLSVSADPTFSFTRASTAANASLTVDGVPISSATNTVTGAISGLTLSLTGATAPGDPATLTVAADSATIQNALSNFVSDYNSALTSVNSQFSFSSSTNSQGALSGDSGIRSLQSILLGVAGYSAAGALNSGGINTLMDLGITVANDGMLSLDSSKLNSALANPSAVRSFLQGSALNGFAQAFGSEIATFNDPAIGSIAKQVQNLNQQYSALGTQVTNYESGYISSQRTVLTAMYSKAEIALQQLPAEMKQIQTQLGNNSSGG
jgi:flagellar hook-associated protein 2